MMWAGPETTTSTIVLPPVVVVCNLWNQTMILLVLLHPIWNKDNEFLSFMAIVKRFNYCWIEWTSWEKSYKVGDWHSLLPMHRIHVIVMIPLVVVLMMGYSRIAICNNGGWVWCSITIIPFNTKQWRGGCNTNIACMSILFESFSNLVPWKLFLLMKIWHQTWWRKRHIIQITHQLVPFYLPLQREEIDASFKGFRLLNMCSSRIRLFSIASRKVSRRVDMELYDWLGGQTICRKINLFQCRNCICPTTWW